MLRWHSLGEAAVPAHDDWMSDAERQVVAGMRFTKRRSEWRLARWTAKQALARTLGTGDDVAALRRIEVRASLEPDTRGAPFVLVDGEPAGVAVSLTDRAGWAVCAVGTAAGQIGCDLELDEPRSAAFVRDYLTEAERRTVADPPAGLGAHAVANLVWSAKESALKVLRTGLRRDTRSVEVTLTGGTGDGWAPLVVTDRDTGSRFPGWWRRYGAFLVTVAGTADHPAPVALDDPPALAAATPVHSWLAEPLA